MAEAKREQAFQKYGELSELLKTAQAEVENKMNDLVQRAEKYLEDFGSSGKVADCLVQELVEALKNTSNALGFSEQCRADWAKHTISLQDKIEKKTVAIERIHKIAKDYFSDTCGECEEASHILQIIGGLRSNI